jgi:hypothetical protein
MSSTTWLKRSVVVMLFALTANVALSLVGAAEAAKPKHTIKEVMTAAHKEKLLDKVVAGDASDADKQKLLDLYISMIESQPKKGDAESWQKLAGAATMAAAKVVVGRDGAIEELKVASNCKACHAVHK